MIIPWHSPNNSINRELICVIWHNKLSKKEVWSFEVLPTKIQAFEVCNFNYEHPSQITSTKFHIHESLQEWRQCEDLTFGLAWEYVSSKPSIGVKYSSFDLKWSFLEAFYWSQVSTIWFENKLHQKPSINVRGEQILVQVGFGLIWIKPI